MKNTLGGFLVIGLYVAFIGGWLQHIYTSVLANDFLMLIFGALIFPVGIIHGWGIWLGTWGANSFFG